MKDIEEHEKYLDQHLKKYIHIETRETVLETPDGTRYLVNPSYDKEMPVTVRDLADEELTGNLKSGEFVDRNLRSLNFPKWEKGGKI